MAASLTNKIWSLLPKSIQGSFRLVGTTSAGILEAIKSTNGSTHTVEYLLFPRSSELYVMNCNADADGITDETAMVAGELYTLTPPSNCVGMTITLDYDHSQSTVPYARGIVFTIDASSDADATTKMSFADNGPGDYASGAASTQKLLLGESAGSVWEKGDVSRVDLGFLLGGGTGASAVKANVNFLYES